MLARLLLLLILSTSTPAWATNYYVATTGNDTTGTGAIDNPWRNPQKCVASGSPIVAGDSCLVGSGTYTDTNSDGYVISISSTSPLGTPSAPITIKSLTPLGAVLDAPATSGAGNRAGIQINRAYYVIEGFDITQSGVAQGTHNHGLVISSGATGLVLRKNTIHHIARTACLSSGANSGLTMPGTPKNVTIERNVFRDIGRLRNGESGCSIPTSQGVLDHAIYVAGQNLNLVVKNNVFYDIKSGYGFHLYTSNGIHSDVYVYNNTFANHPSQGTPKGFILLSGSLTNIQVKNNICYGTVSLFCVDWYLPSAVSVVLANNLTNSTVLTNPSGKPASGLTESNNVTGTSPGFTNAGANNYTLASGSAAINAGVNVSLPFSGSAPDIGAFETFTATAATADVTNIDVTYNPAYGPLQVGGATGHSIGCTTSCGTLSVDNATLFSSADSIARLNSSGWTSGECLSAYTITTSFNASTGSITDSINIGGTLNQYAHSYGPLSVTNNCSEGGSPTPPGTPHRIYELDGDGADTSGNDGPATISGGSFVAGKYGQALQGTGGVAVSALSDYGSGVNPSTQDLVIAFGYEVPAGAESLPRIIAGTALGSGQRFYVASWCGTWQIAIATSGVSCDTPSNLPVHAGWNRLVLVVNATTDVATLYADDVQGTGGATKAIPSYTLASNIAFGLPTGFDASGAGGGKWDRALIYTSLIDPHDDWLAWEPSSAPPTGTYSQVAHRWFRVMVDGSGGAIQYGADSSSINVVKGGAVVLQTQTDCTTGNCSSMGEKLWYTRNGGAEQIVPDSFTSDGVSFWGTSIHPSQFIGTATCCIAGELTPTNGTTQTTNVALPEIALDQDSSIVRNSVLRWASTASGTFCFFEKDQNGSALSSTTPEGGACVTLIDPQASGGF